jgi:hypothetical protein
VRREISKTKQKTKKFPKKYIPLSGNAIYDGFTVIGKQHLCFPWHRCRRPCNSIKYEINVIENTKTQG